MTTTARNKVPAKVRRIKKGEAIANVELDVAGQRLVASIAVEAVDELGLEPGNDILAVFAASDVMINRPQDQERRGHRQHRARRSRSIPADKDHP